MPFDRQLADRIRIALHGRSGVTEKQMFGGIGFLVNGNMCCGVHGEELMVRLDPATAGEALRNPHARVFDLTGRPMRGWILVASDGVAAQDQVAFWVERGFAYASTLPSK
jgi:hypothetical protein